MRSKIMSVVFSSLLFILFCGIVYADQFDFRRINWGMSKSQVLKAENSKADCYDCYEIIPGASVLTYNAKKVFKMDFALHYSFINDILVSASYIRGEYYSEPNGYSEILSDTRLSWLTYSKINVALRKKYGEPKLDKDEWLDGQYRLYFDKYEYAISVGHRVFNTIWVTPKTMIWLGMKGKNRRIYLFIQYSSTEHQSLIDKQNEKEKAKENFEKY